ncbi:mucin TcMUCII, putative, partial [Trypanosoma cruzi marinkellei]
CRLLCALLVLALCCRPSVCVTTSDGDSRSDSFLTHTPPGETVVSGQFPGTPVSPGAGMPDLKDPAKAVQQQAEISATDVSGAQGASSTVMTEGEKEKSEGSGSGPAPPEAPGTVDVTAKSPDKISPSTTKQEAGTPNTGETSSSGKSTVQNPSEEATVGLENEDGEEPTSGTRSDKGEGTSTAPALSEDSDTTMGPTSTEEGPTGSGGSTSGSANPMSQIGTNGTVTVETHENVPNTSTTTTAPEAPSTTTTEAPTTTTTGA